MQHWVTAALKVSAVICEGVSGEGERVSHLGIWREEHSRHREQPVQRLRGESGPGMFQDEP